MFKLTVAAAIGLVAAIWSGRSAAQEAAPSARSAVSQSATAEDSLSGSVRNIDQRVKILERLREVDGESNQKKTEESTVVTANKDGFVLRAPDTSYLLRVRYEGHFDGRYFVGSDTFTAQRQPILIVRRARPIIEARLPGPFFFRIMADLAGGKIDVPDAYVESALDPRIGLRIGKFKSPFSLEVLQSTALVPFLELSLSSQLAPNRDIGGQLQGDFGNGLLSYAVGVFDGVADGSSLDADWNRSKDIAGRLFTQPFRKFEPLKGFGVGGSFTYGNHSDLRKWASGAVPASVPGFKTAGQESFFKYRDTTFGSGNQSRYAVQGHYYIGPFGLIGEYINSSSEITNINKGKSVEKTISNSGWNVATIYALTGEPNGYQGLKPFRNFDPGKGQWGAFELAARISELQIDNNAFPVFADSTKSAKKAIDYTGGINWHLNRNVKVLLNYTQTLFTGGASKGNVPDEKLFAGRVQLVF